MSFVNPNVFLGSDGFWIRWSLIVFLFIVIMLLVYLFAKRRRIKAIINVCNTAKSCVLPLLIYFSTIPIYCFNDIIGGNGESVLYAAAEFINSIESIIVFALIATLAYGITYKNSYTFMTIYFRLLSVAEIMYIITCYITKQVELIYWYNWVGAIALGLIFVLLNIAKLDFVDKSKTGRNIHDAVGEYEALFLHRKLQADEIVDIIESDISESGYSICVNGEWGEGKTSLANGVINKAKKNRRVKIFPIRINAIELDDGMPLIRYFFDRIESILKENNVYVGMASEYRELILSLLGTIVNDCAGALVSRTFNSNSDYRANIAKLNQLLTTNLSDSRILIVIDDLDRCSSEKTKSFLFLMKEIATLHRCISLFLIDVKKLKDDSFLEKFFNYTISLASISYDEILSRNKTEYSDLTEEINKMLDQINVKMKKESTYIDLSNPRAMAKVVEYYTILNKRIDRMIDDCPETKRESVNSYLNKVEYKKQLSLLSIINGLYNDEFNLLQKKGSFDYIFHLDSRLEEGKFQNMNRVGSLIRGEWYENLHELSDDFRTQEILRFINCVLWGLNELPNISNSFNSTAERNISILEGGKIPDGMAFSDLIIMIYKATYTQLSERSRLINRLFELCSGENSMISIDSVFEVFSQRSVCDLISYEIPILQMFYGAFCTKKKSLKDIQKVIKGFNSFAEEYLWRSTSAFSRYLMPITSERNNFGGWVDISDLVYNGIGCENKLNDYCSRCESYLEEGEFPREENILLRLTRITKYADERYNKLEMTECWDVRYCRDNAHKLIVEIEYLLKIESFINESISWTDSNLLNIREIANDNLPKLIDGLYNRMCENIDYYGRNDIHRLLEHIYLKKRNVTLEEYKKLNEIVCKYCEKYNEGIAQWRLMLIQIRNEQIGDTTQKPDESR